MRRATTAAMLALFCCNPAFAQMRGDASAPPTLAATSPLGIAPGSPVPPTGIPFGATELTSTGVSPLTTGTMGMPGFGTTCSNTASPLSGMPSTTTTYDGGGMAMGAALPGSTTMTMGTSLPGSTTGLGTCNTTAATSPTVPGGASRTGIPLGSVEIGNAGISPQVVDPAPGPAQMMTVSPPQSMMAIPLPSTTTSPSQSMTANPLNSIMTTPLQRVR